ncbi:MAG TPA: MBL fold metallo-hydrolase [Steroidobacteraceae bacterium]|jgi:glyoxylase-like metal-dependent hydrolase (beta-lactamase superfamily II)|nr:MBL fold metallo-hydrolase [Steroidobacteraceae bacterium]
MAKRTDRNPASAPGDWYIDNRCIDCAASREVAPGLIVHRDGKSVFARQPASEDEERAAWRAALLCPTASVGTESARAQPPGLFPQQIAPRVYRCGYNAHTSFGAHAYFVQAEDGNLLIDSPRYVSKLQQAFEQMGGIADILLTHRDDVAAADRYARQFGARVWIHEHDRSAAPYATDLLTGTEPAQIRAGLLAIPVPGHTRGSVVYLWQDTLLFAGDSLSWDRGREQLTAFRDVCWYSWDELKVSLGQLAQHRFEWLLPGHGHSVQLDAARMQAQLRALVERM